MEPLSRRTSLVVLALVSASLVAVEVLLTRLLSVTAWYGHAFLVLSLAMLGLTSGSLSALRAREAGAPVRPWIAARLSFFAAALLVAVVVVLATPLVFAPDLTSFGSVLLVAAASTAPMVAAGAVVARLMAESDVPLPLLYGVDLAAAAAGALAPLALLGPLSAPASLALLAALLALASTALAAPTRARRAGPLGLALFALAAVALSRGTHAGFELRYTKGNPRPPHDEIAFEGWNPLSHVSMSRFGVAPFPLWSPAQGVPTPPARVAFAYIDGEAGTPVYAFHDIRELAPLRSDAITAAHALRPSGIACVIGVGGGRDLASALLYGHEYVFGAEINPAMVAMLRAASDQSPILTDPRVRLKIGDGRALFAQHQVQCAVLQASLVDTWAATGAGAFAHTESTLYTREAWAVFLRRVEPAGVLTFSRWYDPENVSETSRLVSLAVAALLDRGVARPAEHLALFAAGRVATILVSPAPFSAEDRATLARLEHDAHFALVLGPGRRPADPLLAELLEARTIHDLDVAGTPYGMDTSPPTDDRPFFFQTLSARSWLHPIETVRAAAHSQGVLAGNTTATLELLMTFLAVALVGAALLGPTLYRAARAHRSPLPSARAGAYFGALGAGFMLAEVALVQRMHVALGHPTYALIVVLAGLLVATGLGSALSPLWIRSRRAVTLAALGAGLLLAALPFAVIRPLARATMDSSFAVRVAWTGGTAALVGLILGTLFPSGLRYVSRTRGAPAALALNGVTSVLGSVSAILVSVWAGIPASFVVAGAIYAVAALAGPHGWPEPDGD